MNSPAKTLSGTPCKRCLKKGAKCAQHGGSVSPKTSSTRKVRTPLKKHSPKKAQYETMTEEEWERMKFERQLGEKLVKIASPAAKQASPRGGRASPKMLRSPKAGRAAQPTDEYEADIIEFLKVKEQKYRIPPNYTPLERERNITVDWLISVADEYHVSIKTLHLGVALFDLVMFRSPIKLSLFQLYACACMLIAGKYEERFAPAVEDYVYISDNTFTRQALINAESAVLGILQFDVTIPTCIDFAEFYHDALDLDEKHKAVSNYVMDASMITTSSFSYSPSLIAAASVFYANLALSPDAPGAAWTAKMTRVTGYTYQEVRDLLPSILRWLNPDPKLKELGIKYGRSKNFKVAELPLVRI